MQEQSTHKDSAAGMIIGIVSFILALGFVTVFMLVPQISTLITSMEKFSPVQGLFNSPFAGLDNYLQAINMPGFATGLAATFSHSFYSALFLFLSSLATGYLLLVVGRVRWLRHALCTLLLIPLIIPADIWLWIFVELKLYIVPADNTAAMLLAGWCTIKYVGLPALLVTAAISHGKRSWSVPLLAGGAASLILFVLLGRFDFGFMRQMPPMLYPVVGIDALAFRMSILNMQLGTGAAINVMLSIFSAIAMAAGAFPIAMMLKRLFPAGSAPDDLKPKDRLVSLIIPAALALAAAAALAIVSGGDAGMAAGAFAAYPVYIALAIFGAAVNTILCFFLARPAATSGKAGRSVMTIILVGLTAVGLNAVSVGEYMSARFMGMANTWFAVALSGIGAVWGVWPLVFAARGLGVNSGADWFRRMWKPAAGLFAVQLILMVNNTLPSLLHMSRASNLHPFILAMQPNSELSFALTALITLALPVALLLTVRTVFNEKDNLALFLPGK